MKAELKFIGHIETPYKTIEECPRNIQQDGPLCRLIINENFKDGLFGLASGNNILILYWFENVKRNRYRQKSRKTGKLSGVFALRTPDRPNPIGVAMMQIETIENNSIWVRGLDCLNKTPLLDIKPTMKYESV